MVLRQWLLMGERVLPEKRFYRQKEQLKQSPRGRTESNVCRIIVIPIAIVFFGVRTLWQVLVTD